MTNDREGRLKMMRGAGLIGALGVAGALGGCSYAGYPACYTVCAAPYPIAYPAAYAPHPTPWDDPFADYTQRILTVSPTAGNAQAANVALQTRTPWPRYSSNTNIPGNGARMVKAVEDYEKGVTPPPSSLGSVGGAGQAASPAGGGGGGGAAGGGGGASGGGGAAPAGGS